jgi:D-alanyl-D-alanine carboxypeptidase
VAATIEQPAVVIPAPTVEIRRHRGRWALVGSAGVLVLAIGAVAVVQMLRPVPEATLHLTIPASHTLTGDARLALPSTGESTVQVGGLGTVSSSSGQTPTPTASLAKVMTAYIFLTDHPLHGGSGPAYDISAHEASLYKSQLRQDQSLIKVRAGEPFTERQALEAMLIVSANNIADSVAVWDAGSTSAFLARMNATAKRLGMNHTDYTDPSGFTDTTVSTAADQVKLFRAAMKLPVFAQIVAERTFSPPDGALPLNATDTALGTDGLIGGKTGNTGSAGANFVFAAHRKVGGDTVTVYGAVMGQPDGNSPASAISAGQQLLVGLGQVLVTQTVAPAHVAVGYVDDGLGRRTSVVTQAPITVIGWPGLTVRLRITTVAPHTAPAGTRIATVAQSGGLTRTQVVASKKLTRPSWTQRLFRKP